MKLHEDEVIETSKIDGTWVSWRTAVPGGWLYFFRPTMGVATTSFVPDPIAEHVRAVSDEVRQVWEVAYGRGVSDSMNIVGEYLERVGVKPEVSAPLGIKLRCMRPPKDITP